MSSSFPQFSPTSEQGASQPGPSTPSATRGKGTGAKKPRKSRAASSAASPATFSDDLQAGAAVQWATPAQPLSTGIRQGVSRASLGPSSARASPIRSSSQRPETPIAGKTEGVLELTIAPDGLLAGLRARVGMSGRGAPAAAEEDAEGDDDLLPDMADDDYSAQLSWQSQSKDNLKVLMDNFTPEQYDRYEAYRRNALPKQAVRRVIQQSLGQQVSMPVAQVVAGFAKVFVGEIVEKARNEQQRRGEAGPLSPDHLREAYRAYQEETGRIGASRPLRGKKLFVR